MTVINSKTLKKFLNLAGDKLQGSWVIIGGAVIQLFDDHARVTLDIDLAGPENTTQKEIIQVMDIAQTLGLPVEAINHAGAYFLRKIKAWDQNLIEIHRGKTAVFHRPNATLYLLLKLNRFTETDLADCLKFIEIAKKNGEMIDRKRIKNAVSKIEKQTLTTDKAERLQTLMNALS